MIENMLDKDLICHHCGEQCDDDRISTDENYFCCYGCKAVNELLTNSELNQHYSETSKENSSISERRASRKYAFLENEDIQKELLRFRDDRLSVIRFSLPSIHCSSCIYLLEHLPKLNSSIIRSEVNFIKREVVVTFIHESLSLKDLAILLSQVGYPPDISLDSLDNSKLKKVRSTLGVKIAIAGFCFGNAMLMSMPEYLDTQFQLTDDFKGLFGWISLLLTLPIVFYSGNDYFIKAWKGIRVGRPNIDLPIALGILTLFARSTFEILSQTGMGYADSLTGLVFFLLIGKWYQGKTYQALSFERDYASYFPVSITCLIDGAPFTRSLKELQKGDVVVIHNDELIPADGHILEGKGNIDYSFVTGESAPVERSKADQVFAGGRQKGGELIIQLDKKVNNSELTNLWNAEVFVKERADLYTWVDKISAYFTLTIVLLAVVTGVYWYFSDSAMIWNAVTAVLIVACPCALALVLPFAYGHAMRLYGRNGLYLKNAEVVESMANVRELVFDKTGTLTKNEANVTFIGEALRDEEVCLLKSVLGNSAHPLSRIVHQNLPLCMKKPLSYFTEETGKGITAEIDGIIIKIGSASYIGAENNTVNNESHVHVSIGTYKGYFSIASTYRNGIFETLKSLKSQYRLHLLSGDNTGEKARLEPYFDETRFSQKPQDKLNFLSHITENSLMIGDGLNDSGALKKANVGIAVADDIHQFSPACDAILSSDKVENIPSILVFSKRVVSVVFIAFGLSFLYNIVGLSFAMTGHLTPLISAILMPISSVTVVGFVTMMVQWRGRILGKV